MSPIVVDKVAKKQEILQAALSVFAQKGVQSTKMADIATAANIGKGTIYEYFRSKNEVLTETFQYFAQQMSNPAEAQIEKLANPEKKLRTYIQGIFNAANNQSETITLMFDMWAEGLREGGNFDLNAIYTQYRERLSSFIEEGIAQTLFRPVDPKATATIFIATIDGLLLQWVLDTTLFDLEKMGHTLTDTLLQGIQTK